MEEIIFKGITFVTGKSKKFDKDLAKAMPILSRKYLTSSDKLELLSIYETSYHDDGKIEGASSCDSSCNGCDFCTKMREAAKKDPTIICGYCYDAAQESRWINVKNRHGLNLLIMSATDYSEDELHIVHTSFFTRINSSGETPNEVFARNNLRIAKVNPMFHFGYWAKNKAPVQQACEDLGKPENVSLVQSSIHIGRADKLSDYFDYVFTVYADDEEIKNAIENGGCECNGRKCMKCGWKCYMKTHNATNIAELLKASAKKREEILKAVKG